MFYFLSYLTSVNMTLTFKKWRSLKWLYCHFLGKVQVFCKSVQLHIVRAELQYDLSQQLLHFFNSDEVYRSIIINCILQTVPRKEIKWIDIRTARGGGTLIYLGQI